ncbi:MAG: SGNH/GDSL hydrolase family protein [Vitreoscilla sp.]
MGASGFPPLTTRVDAAATARPAPRRIATLACKLALLPVLLAQGRRVRENALRLPEAAGERHGVAGRGRVALRVLIVGDSSAAGVGVGTQDEAFAGQLAQSLAERTGAAVGWQLVATSGHTAGDAAHALAGATLQKADLLVTALGVNDVLDQTRPPQFLAALDEIHALAVTRAQVTHTWHCGLPPLGSFVLLPQPLRWILGRDASHLDGALLRHLEGQATRLHLPLPDAPRMPGKDDATPEGWMARDGFHPGLLGYRQWGRQVAEAIG